MGVSSSRFRWWHDQLRTDLAEKRDLGTSRVTECNELKIWGLREEGPKASGDTLLPSLNAIASDRALHGGDLEVQERKSKVKHFCTLKGHLQQAPTSFSLVRRMCQMLDEQFYSLSPKQGRGKKQLSAIGRISVR